MYKDAKLEAKKVVRNAKNEEWMQMGKELEKDAWGNQRKVWARINESRRPKDRMAHIYDKNGEVLLEEHLKDCSRKQMCLTRIRQGEEYQ